MYFFFFFFFSSRRRHTRYWRDWSSDVCSSDLEQFFPSPSVFVYTLPNIVTGEIAIRNHYHGETHFFVIPAHDTQLMRRLLTPITADPLTRSVVTGWIEAPDEQHIYTELQLRSEEHTSE